LVIATNAQAVDIGFEFGAGLVLGGDHADALEESYATDDSTGLGAFLELNIGVPIGVTENVVVKPKISFLFSPVSVDYGYDESDTYLDTIIIPAIAAEYYINGFRSDSIFLGLELGVPSPSSGNDAPYPYEHDFKSDGISWGIYGGYNFSNAKFSVGYRSIPIEHTDVVYGSDSKNFGGVSFQFAYALYFD
jgi:hypothetical protein